jgi:hypothetical protein
LSRGGHLVYQRGSQNGRHPGLVPHQAVFYPGRPGGGGVVDADGGVDGWTRGAAWSSEASNSAPLSEDASAR